MEVSQGEEVGKGLARARYSDADSRNSFTDINTKIAEAS